MYSDPSVFWSCPTKKSCSLYNHYVICVTLFCKLNVDYFQASLLSKCCCTPVLYDGPDLKLFTLVGWDRSSFACRLVHRGSTDVLLLLKIFSGVVWQTRDLHTSRNTLYLLRPRLCLFIFLKRDLFVFRDDSLTR